MQIPNKDSEIKTAVLCLANISKDFSTDNMKNIGLYGYVSGFSFDYDIHKYLVKKHDMK